MDRPAHVLKLLSQAYAQNFRARTHTLNQFLSPLSIHISIAWPRDANKPAYTPNSNPILYIFYRCQSVRMKCCLLALGKSPLSSLAKCGSSFICLVNVQMCEDEKFCDMSCYAIFSYSVIVHFPQNKISSIPRKDNCTVPFKSNLLTLLFSRSLK